MKLLAVAISIVLLASQASAATRTWDGGGGDNLASTAANWSSDTAPVAGDAIVFDATSTKACTWDISAATTFGSFSINEGAQSITLNNSLNLSGAYTQASGTVTFNTGSPTITAGADSAISGGTITHALETNNTNIGATYSVRVSVTGNLDIQTPISVDGKGHRSARDATCCVYYGTGSGYAPGKGHNGNPAVGNGGALGGDGAPGKDTSAEDIFLNYPPGTSGYASISSPNSPGSGGGSRFNGEADDAFGGGVIYLSATGTLTVGATISADASAGSDDGRGGPSGGSVRIVAGTLAGSGAIHANGGSVITNSSTSFRGSGGGGIVSLSYTHSTYSGPVDAKSGGIHASNGNEAHAAAGIIWDAGVIRVKNESFSTHTNTWTRINSVSNAVGLELTAGARVLLVADLTLSGDVSIGSGTTLNLNGYTLTVGGNFTNSGTFTANAGTVIFNGSGTSTISGSSTFQNLTCTTPGKALTFAASSTQTISGTLTLTGSMGSPITIRSSSAGTRFTLTPNGSKSASWLDVKDSLASSEIVASNSIDSGNNVGWVFEAPPSGRKHRASLIPNTPLEWASP